MLLMNPLASSPARRAAGNVFFLSGGAVFPPVCSKSIPGRKRKELLFLTPHLLCDNNNNNNNNPLRFDLDTIPTQQKLKMYAAFSCRCSVPRRISTLGTASRNLRGADYAPWLLLPCPLRSSAGSVSFVSAAASLPSSPSSSSSAPALGVNTETKDLPLPGPRFQDFLKQNVSAAGLNHR